jgi:hypothetical protein
MPDPITFMTRLTDAEWDEVIGGWRCPALQIPGATVDGIYVEGSQVDSGRFQVLEGQHIVRWMPSDKPQRVAVVIKLTKELALGSETDKWKKRAILLPFIATIVAALITAIPAYWSKLDPLPRHQVPAPLPQPQHSTLEDPTNKAADDDGRIPQWIPRYPGSRIQGVSIQGNVGSYYFESSDHEGVVTDFFFSRLRMQGMRPQRSFERVELSSESGQLKFLLTSSVITHTDSRASNRYTITFAAEGDR